MSSHTYVVIGSNCFTGSHIVDLLLDDPTNRVIGVSRSPEKNPVFLPYKRHPNDRFRFHQIDLARQPDLLLSLLDEVQPSYVINVAALSEVHLSHFQPLEYFQTNCLGIVHFSSQLRTRPYLKRYVHISTAEVYGSCDSPVTESASLNPTTPYAVSKAAADLYLATLHKHFGFPVIFIRSTNVYGKHQQLFKIIPRTIFYLKKGEIIKLHGGGQAVKSWIHIRDVAKGVSLALQKGCPGEIYNFSDENACSVANLVQTLCNKMGYDFKASTVSVDERQGQDAQYLLDYSKARRKLGWSPEVLFEEGLKETIAWVEDYWEFLSDEPHLYVHKV